MFSQHTQAGLAILRIVGCAYEETEIIPELRQMADQLCSDENETGAAVFFAEPKEWKKQWNSMNWTEMGVRKVPDVPRPHEDPNTKAGTGEELRIVNESG